MIRNGILLHVYHLEAAGWENLVWGYPNEDRLGTLTQFAHMLLTIPASEQVRSIVFSGPSLKEGLAEGAYTKEFLLRHIDELTVFPSLKPLIDNLSVDEYELFVRRINELVVGREIKNTREEIACAAQFFTEADAVDRVFQIAAASHAPRCLQNQIIARSSGEILPHQPWHVVASDACFADTSPEDVVILEPPHRGDDPMVGFTPTLSDALKPYFSMDVENKQRLINTIQDAVDGLDA